MVLFDPPAQRRCLKPADLFLHHISAQNLIDRLSVVKKTFRSALVLGHGAHALIAYLTTQGCQVTTSETYPICSYGISPTLAASSFDLVCCNLNLHWVNDLPGFFIQIHKSLQPDGLFLGSFLGQDTLSELRESFLQIEALHRSGAMVHVSPMIELATATNLLQRTGFSIPVGDHDRQRVTYKTPLHLMKDLQRMGESNRCIHRHKALYAPRLMQQVIHYYQEHFSVDQRIYAHFDFCYLTGWVPHESQQKALKPGSATHPLSKALSE